MAGKLIDRTPSAYDYPLLIRHLLHTPLVYSPHQEILYRDLKRYDYVTFRNRLGRLANALRALGVEPGNTVAVMDWDSHRYLECFFAVPMMGAVLHTINTRLSLDEIRYIISHAEDDVILVHTDFLPLLEKMRNELKTVRKIVLLTDKDESPETGLDLDGDYESLLNRSSSDYDFPDFDENTRATTFYTTGRTGSPKGVYYSHRQLVLHTLGVLGGFGLSGVHGCFNSADVYMPLAPMFHVHSWGFPYAATLVGAKQVYVGRYEAGMIFSLIRNEKVTLSHCFPSTLRRLLNNPLSKETDLSGLKLIVGGAVLPEVLCRAALDLGIDVFGGYGMSETCPMLTISKLKPHMANEDEETRISIRRKAGLPVPLVSLRLVNAAGKELPHDGLSTGEVVVRAPWLTQGYSEDPEKSEDLWSDGWLHTGDVGNIDEEGYLQITDRIKDVIRTGGEWVSSETLEDILSQHEAVHETAVIGVPDEKWGERPLAFVVLEEKYKGMVSEEDLRSFFLESVAKGILAKWAVPDRIVIVEALAKTSVGKINKRLLRQQIR